MQVGRVINLAEIDGFVGKVGRQNLHAAPFQM